MSMLNKLKETQKNPVFMDDDDDIDNMDFPLPSAGSSSSAGGMPDMNEIQKLMKNLSAGTSAGSPSIGSVAGGSGSGSKNHIAVANTPQGVRRLEPSQYKDWVCVYPSYIDVDKSVADGRKIAKSKAVKDPHAYHMAVAVQMLGLSVVYETKRHPRDWANPGRVKVKLFDDNHRPMISNIRNRKELFAAIAERVPALQKSHEKPKNVVTPITSLAEVEAIVDEQRKAQGLPTLAEMQAQNPMPNMPTKPKKQKVKYVRG